MGGKSYRFVSGTDGRVRVWFFMKPAGKRSRYYVTHTGALNAAKRMDPNFHWEDIQPTWVLPSEVGK